ncbi:MAG: NADH-ubiquinone oxidoreductase-F iron-sulfur binding region domain-containing protein [bacterium]|nr:NADH-ubiquinone oxidoreductase-F iron-sulfur binding region domain-containing protein [bacterium]
MTIQMDILEKIKQAGLVGRGGAGFLVAKKWSAVKDAAGDPSASSPRPELGTKAGQVKKYVVCNAAEGEPGLVKDSYILEHHADKVIDGMKIAINFLSVGSEKNKPAVKGYIFLNHAYNKKLNKKLAALLKDSAIEIFIKPIESGYIGGEESAVLNAIEGRRIEPRLKPPFPVTHGLWGFPTLVNNVETFYNVNLVNSDQYKNNRFYDIAGDCPNEGVYELPADLTIEKVLKETKNYPKFPFFAQVGGDMAGEVLSSRQLKGPATGAGSITVFSLAKNNYKKIITGWLDFFADESCGQCTPCREGTYRLREVFMEEKIDWVLFNDLLDNLADASFCALGGSVVVPIRSFMKNVLPEMEAKK